MTKLVILDRDGVINQDSKYYIKNPDEWHAISGSLEAIAKLNNAGFKVAVATNQSGIARRYYTLQTLSAIHKKMRNELTKVNGNIERIAYCPHGPDNKCTCRKPKPGLILQLCEYFKIKLPNKQVFFVGDSLRDLQAAQAAGVQPVLVLTGNGSKTVLKNQKIESTVAIYKDLHEFALTFAT